MPLSIHDIQKLRNLSVTKRQTTTEGNPTQEKSVNFDFTIQEIEEEEDEEDTETFVEQRRTFHSDLDKLEGPMLPPEHNKDALFVVVQILEKGDVFGLQDIVYSEQPNLSLVSNGAECVMIRKQFYLDEAKEETLRILRKEVIPYPSKGEMQEYLQQQLDWDAFKYATLSATVYESRATKVQRLRPASIR
ncbi:uncharacterized protein [Apostichopus japonicus]|uniref:uncharacterized protein n=1 Tax=Stichopus japonicus TaxID=307972 RepID=UPI003AB82FA7